MLTRNVIYSEKPSKAIVYHNSKRARVEFPLDVTEIETEDGSQWEAAKVYSFETAYTESLADRINENYEEWLEKAKQTDIQPTTLNDVVEAINALQELVLGGEV